ncbi:uncharacterized protein VICG_01224 [Vittaforma corneae ATCC 50505]|uniref:Uncharacterized protein n=1 Tax=Vittaforma corneae (strain ATCC 50505) TaxID=993615 RepID=L2GMK3_VITCO|nr:uncharacterized protein VICG_01224 [Vittaforma corneae ATCC 50505]ELA41720.1 hypothetical protein VICG_01224 [Vittaforma corneae ATCC 50505]
MNTVNKIVEIFQVLKTSIEDDMSIYELVIKMKREYSNALNKNTERLMSKNRASSGLLIYTSLKFVQEEWSQSEIICTFLQSNPLDSSKILHQKICGDLRKFQENLKNFYDQDKALCENIHKEQCRNANDTNASGLKEQLSLLSIEEQRNELILQNLPALKANIEMAVKSINECISALDNEYKRLHLFVNNLLKNQQSKFEYPSLALDKWDNINFQKFKTLLENELKIDDACRAKPQYILKEDVRIKEGWGSWECGVFILYPRSIVITETGDVDDMKTATGNVREYKLAITDMSPIGTLTLKLTCKNQGVISYLLGLNLTIVEFSSQSSRDRVIGHLNSTVA